ncbi:protein of unknown function [Pseudodesulfovibrio profundus]|uniref:Uncharacterized protein n=1 Tax=Pseudodesulfovibrio profundus TaxID=57320 RepID=A0A2C8F4J3_9BACT|nr:protein of unknown function [Pseudodesulfovibrio profundus]
MNDFWNVHTLGGRATSLGAEQAECNDDKYESQSAEYDSPSIPKKLPRYIRGKRLHPFFQAVADCVYKIGHARECPY